jgi:hypothetical protein
MDIELCPDSPDGYRCLRYRTHAFRCDVHHAYDREGKYIEWPDPVPDTRQTVAVRVCAECDRYVGTTVWRGKDATDADWCVSHTICDLCLGEVA